MATKPAAPSPMTRVRDKESKVEHDAYPIDARELVASGHYEYVEEQPASRPAAEVAPPSVDGMQRVRFKDTGEISKVFPIDATEMVAGGDYEYAPESDDAKTSAEESGPIAGIAAGGATELIATFTPIADLPAKLAAVTDADELMALEAADPRAEAKELYFARFEELANAPRV